MRAFLASEEQRVRLLWGALMLLVWVIVVWAFWWFLDWCHDHFLTWASYLNSRAPAYWRARVLTYQHIYNWLVRAEWILRWIVTPAKVIPYAMASAQWGWRLHWRRAFHLLWNWRWWLAVTLVALAAVALPAHLFAGLPRGTVSHQVASVIFKLFLSWVLILGGWVFLLGWAAVLMEPSPTRFTAGREWQWLRREVLIAATPSPARGRSGRAIAPHTMRLPDGPLPHRPLLQPWPAMHRVC